MSKYIDLYPNCVLGNGLVSQISDIAQCPWNSLPAEEKANIERLYAIRSANKIFVSLFSEINENVRAHFVLAMFREKWQKLWDTYHAQYDPLNAYSVTESGNETRDLVRIDTTTYGRTMNETGTDTGTVNSVGTNSGNGQDNVFGFNSVSAVPSNSATNTNNSEDTQTRNLEATRNTTQGGEDNFERGDVETVEYSKDKQGNLGFKSPQQLLMEEFNLWKTPFLEKVFQDIDYLIMLKIYE